MNENLSVSEGRFGLAVKCVQHWRRTRGPHFKLEEVAWRTLNVWVKEPDFLSGSLRDSRHVAARFAHWFSTEASKSRFEQGIEGQEAMFSAANVAKTRRLRGLRVTAPECCGSNLRLIHASQRWTPNATLTSKNVFLVNGTPFAFYRIIGVTPRRLETPRFPSQHIYEIETVMKAKQIFFNAATVCMVATAVMMTQAMFNGAANADQRGDAAGGDLKQRIADLEERQDENDIEFVLVDRTLADLNARINANDADIRAQDGRIGKVASHVQEVEKRYRVLRAEHRALADMVKRMAARD